MIIIIISIEAMGKQCNGKRQAQLEKKADAADTSVLFFPFGLRILFLLILCKILKKEQLKNNEIDSDKNRTKWAKQHENPVKNTCKDKT